MTKMTSIVSTVLVLTIVSLVRADDLLDHACKIARPLSNNSRCFGNRDRETKFYLHTKSQPNPYELKAGDADRLKNSGYLQGKPLKLMIHGYGGGLNDNFPKETKNAYLNLDDEMNVLIVDWTAASNPIRGYTRVVSCARPVSHRVVDMIKFLMDQNQLTSLDDLHVIGHSLGAQIAGMAGFQLDNNIARITGLDPARPCFRHNDTTDENRLGPSDAKFVDVVHTDGYNGRNLARGLMEQVGHIDFYANGGRTPQPGCRANPLDNCSHFRVHNLFTESISNPNGFPSRRCENYEKFLKGDCDLDSVTMMGEFTPVTQQTRSDPPPQNDGVPFYFRTSNKCPFALGERGARGRD